jgi:hypothetical protein
VAESQRRRHGCPGGGARGKEEQAGHVVGGGASCASARPDVH